MKVNFLELRKEWTTKVKNDCDKLLADGLCEHYRKEHPSLDEKPIKCDMHICPYFKTRLTEALKPLGIYPQEREKVAPKEKEVIKVIKVDKV